MLFPDWRKNWRNAGNGENKKKKTSMEDQVINILKQVTIFEIVKWFFAVGMVMYIVFAGVIVRQVKVMTEAIEDEFNGIVAVLAWAHLLLAISILVTAVVVL